VRALCRFPWRRTLVLLALLINAAAPARGEEPLGVPNPHWGAFFSGKDQRVPIEPTDWPWRAIGRVNLADRVVRRHCTGTLVGPRLVVTAGHCLFNHRLGRWAKPEQVHFVAGQARDTAAGHSTAVDLILPPELDVTQGIDPRLGTIRSELIAHDWALIVLESACRSSRSRSGRSPLAPFRRRLRLASWRVPDTGRTGRICHQCIAAVRPPCPIAGPAPC